MNEINRFYVIGFNYKNLDVDAREAIIKKNIETLLYNFHDENKINGFIYLATCLRIEFYIYINENFNINKFIEALDIESYYRMNGIEAVEYLFNVTCGMDSIIIGENQILTQLKKAFFKYMNEGKTCPELNTIFNNAVSCGKLFRHKSCIDSHGISLERNIYNFLCNESKDLKHKTFFLIGTGDLIKSLLYVLKKEKIKKIILTTKTEHKLKEIKSDFNVESIGFNEKYEGVKKADIIISATSAPHLIIKKDKCNFDLNNKIFLDLAVPRDIDTDILKVKGVKLFNIEDVFKLSNENMEKRKEVSQEYKYVIEDQIEKCIKWFNGRKSSLWVNKK